MAGQKLSSMRTKIWRAAVLRSGMLTTIILVILLGGLVLFVKERGKGHLSKLERELQIKPKVVVEETPPPGGQEAVLLKRRLTGDGTMPEFVSATLLPGRGMNIFQIVVSIPSRGEVPLLLSPTLEQAAEQMRGDGDDAQGFASLALGSAIEAPWADRLGGVATPDGQSVLSVWQGQTMILPIGPKDSGVGPGALGGLMLKRQSDSSDTTVLPDGWQNRSVYNAGAFDGHWLSQTEVTTTTILNARSMEITVVAKNVGPVAEPMGIGWRPRFMIPSGDRANATLRLPNAMRIEVRGHEAGARYGMPTGKLLPFTDTELDFTGRTGSKLGTKIIDETFVHLRQGMLDSGPVVELRDMTGQFGLRITPLTASIKALRINAPEGKPWVGIDPQLNYDDPFGKEWAKEEDTGMATLQPGQSVQWKVRVELFPLAMQSPHF